MAAMLGVGIILLAFLLVGWGGRRLRGKVPGPNPGMAEPGRPSLKT